MSFNEIWALVSPYISTTAVIAVVGLVIKIAMSVKAESKRMALTIKNNTDILGLFKKSLPSELVVSIEKLSGQAFEQMVTDLEQSFVAPITNLGEVVTVLAKAVLCLKSVPDDVRHQLLTLLEKQGETPEEEQKIILEVNKDLEVYASTETTRQKIYTE